MIREFWDFFKEFLCDFFKYCLPTMFVVFVILFAGFACLCEIIKMVLL